MNRRSFLRTSTLASAALLTSAPLLADAVSSGVHPGRKIGYQLFSIRDEMAVRPKDTLGKLKAMGYEDFEIYGFDPKTNLIYGMPPSELKATLDDLGLTASSGHFWFADLFTDDSLDIDRLTDDYIQAARTLGSSYITWPVIGEDLRTEANFDRIPGMLNRIGERGERLRPGVHLPQPRL